METGGVEEDEEAVEWEEVVREVGEDMEEVEWEVETREVEGGEVVPREADLEKDAMEEEVDLELETWERVIVVVMEEKDKVETDVEEDVVVWEDNLEAVEYSAKVVRLATVEHRAVEVDKVMVEACLEVEMAKEEDSAVPVVVEETAVE